MDDKRVVLTAAEMERVLDELDGPEQDVPSIRELAGIYHTDDANPITLREWLDAR